jgi:hypothetical protein
MSGRQDSNDPRRLAEGDESRSDLESHRLRFFRYAREQITRGLVPFDGRWVKPSERESELTKQGSAARRLIVEVSLLIAVIAAVTAFIVWLAVVLAY